MDDFAPVLDELTAYEPNVKDRLVGLLRKAANNLNPNLFPTNERKRELLEPAKSVIPEQSGPAQEALTTEMMMGAAGPGGLGGGVAGTLIGRGAKTFPHANLARALRNMHLNDQNNKGYAHEVGQDAIWKDTKIERVPRLNQYKDVDYWSEIPDKDMAILNRTNLSKPDIYSGPMQGKIRWDTLYNAYPEMADMPLDFYTGPGLKYGGAFWPQGKAGKIEIVAPNYGGAKQALHHEAGGHGVAYAEDWQPGTDPKILLNEMVKSNPTSASARYPAIADNLYLNHYGEGISRLNEYRSMQEVLDPVNNELIRPTSDLNWMRHPRGLDEMTTKQELANLLRKKYGP